MRYPIVKIDIIGQADIVLDVNLRILSIREAIMQGKPCVCFLRPDGWRV